jgi:hypothetical protein
LEATLFGKKPNKVDLKQKIEQGKKAKQETRATKQTTAEAPKKEAPEPEMEIGGDAILGMFEDAAAAQPAVKTEEASRVTLDLALPKSWSGKTPKTTLLEWYRYVFPPPSPSPVFLNISFRNKLKGSNVKIKGTGLKFNISKKGGGFWCEVTNKGTGIKSADEWEIGMPEDEVCAAQEEAENYAAVCYFFDFFYIYNCFFISLFRLLRFTSSLRRWEYIGFSPLFLNLCGYVGKMMKYAIFFLFCVLLQIIFEKNSCLQIETTIQ